MRVYIQPLSSFGTISAETGQVLLRLSDRGKSELSLLPGATVRLSTVTIRPCEEHGRIKVYGRAVSNTAEISIDISAVFVQFSQSSLYVEGEEEEWIRMYDVSELDLTIE